MRIFWLSLLLGALIISGGCEDMHQQVSLQPQEAPRLTAPTEAVPVTGKERLEFGQALTNPQANTPESRQLGQNIYAVNCAPCHGNQGTYPSKVGSHFDPLPPNLRDGHLTQYDEATLFQMFSLGFGRMPAFQKRLPVNDRWHLVNYLHSPQEAKKEP